MFLQTCLKLKISLNKRIALRLILNVLVLLIHPLQPLLQNQEVAKCQIYSFHIIVCVGVIQDRGNCRHGQRNELLQHSVSKHKISAFCYFHFRCSILQVDKIYMGSCRISFSAHQLFLKNTKLFGCSSNKKRNQRLGKTNQPYSKNGAKFETFLKCSKTFLYIWGYGIGTVSSHN